MALRVLFSAAVIISTADAFAAFQRLAPVTRSSAVTMQFSNPFAKGGEKIPKGWKKVKSQSREGEFSYVQVSTGKRYDKLPQSSFYDDEQDTVSGPAWDWRAEEKRIEQNYRSPQEAAGFNADGGDLANTGGVIYLATVPFLLFALFYLFGAIGSPYSRGNF